MRDISIQRRESDLVLATFGRGFYILDDYSPLRAAADLTGKSAALLPARPTLDYTEYSRLGGGKGDQGETYFTAPNPPDGATISYYLKDSLKTLKEKREEMERDLTGKKQTPPYPTSEQLRAEADEDPPAILLTVTDADGKAVRRLTGPASAGLHRVTWDLRGAGFFAITDAGAAGRGRRFGGGGGGGGFRVVPGSYRVSLAKRENGVLTDLAGPITLTVTSEGDEKLSSADRRTLIELRRKVARLQSAVQGAGDTLDTLLARVAIARQAVQDAPQASPKLRGEAVSIEKRLQDIDIELRGDQLTAARNEPIPPSIVTYTSNITFGMFGSSSMPTKTRLESYRIAAEEFSATLAQLRTIATTDFPRLERQMDAAGVPYTPGRLPDWRDN